MSCKTHLLWGQDPTVSSPMTGGGAPRSHWLAVFRVGLHLLLIIHAVAPRLVDRHGDAVAVVTRAKAQRLKQASSKSVVALPEEPTHESRTSRVKVWPSR